MKKEAQQRAAALPVPGSELGMFLRVGGLDGICVKVIQASLSKRQQASAIQDARATIHAALRVKVLADCQRVKGSQTKVKPFFYRLQSARLMGKRFQVRLGREEISRVGLVRRRLQLPQRSTVWGMRQCCSERIKGRLLKVTQDRSSALKSTQILLEVRISKAMVKEKALGIWVLGYYVTAICVFHPRRKPRL